MSLYVKSSSKLSRSVGEKLFLKGSRDDSAKNAMTRRPYGPGQHGQSRHGKPSNYAKQLKEKQKARYVYNCSERQLRRFFKIASRSRGNTGERLLQILESRIDNIVYRSGFADSRRQATQIVSHGHILLNGRKVTTPSILLKPKDIIKVTKNINQDESPKKPEMPGWLKVDNKKLSAQLVAYPGRIQITTPLEEQLIVEYYSRLI